MKTMVIVGAGPGLGFSLAKTFGKQGFQIALVSRSQDKLDQYAEQLGGLGIMAKGFAADITDKEQLTQAFHNIRSEYGPIDVMEISPFSGNIPITRVLDTTDESVIPIFYNVVIGAINVARLVIPEMTERGEGAILFTSELSAMGPSPMFGNIGISMAGLRNYILNLHDKLLSKGIFVGHLSISPLTRKGSDYDPDYVAEAWYQLFTDRTVAESTYPPGMMQRLS